MKWKPNVVKEAKQLTHYQLYSMKQIIKFILPIIGLLILFSSCLEDEYEEMEQIWYISDKTEMRPYMYPDDPLQEHLVVHIGRENGPLTYPFKSQIEGFDYEAGFKYRILVSIQKLRNPYADGPNSRISLKKILTKVSTK